jgi:hypothetical protein
MKICKKCNQEKELEMFYQYKTKNTYFSKCKNCCRGNSKPKSRKIINNNIICYKCNKIKSINEFNKNKRLKFGISNICKTCHITQNKKHNIKIGRKPQKKLYFDNINKECGKCSKILIINNFNKNKSSKDGYQSFCNKCRNIIMKKYRLNKPYIFICQDLLNATLKYKGGYKNDRTYKLMGYRNLELKNHLEKLFTHEMNWFNRGNGENQWNVDHKIPISWFKENTPVYIINHLSNLQPLMRKDNISKSNTFFSYIDDIEYYKIYLEYIKNEKKQLLIIHHELNKI